VSSSESTELKVLLVALAILSIIAVTGAVLFDPYVIQFIDLKHSPGLGLKDAVIASFILTKLTIVTLSIFAGDGLLGVIQFLLYAFGSFFLTLWFLIA